MNKTHLQNFISKVSPVAFAAASLFVLGAASARAATDTWTTTTSGTLFWSNTGNWAGGNVAGTVGTTNDVDTAAFTLAPSAVVTLTVDSGRNVENITFSVSNANAYVINSASATTPLVLTAGGTISSIGTGTAANQVNAAISLEGNYTFQSNGVGALIIGSTTSGFTSNFITEQTSGTLTLTGTLGVETPTTILSSPQQPGCPEADSGQRRHPFDPEERHRYLGD